jgi:hypothetical protein
MPLLSLTISSLPYLVSLAVQSGRQLQTFLNSINLHLHSKREQCPPKRLPTQHGAKTGKILLRIYVSRQMEVRKTQQLRGTLGSNTDLACSLF